MPIFSARICRVFGVLSMISALSAEAAAQPTAVAKFKDWVVFTSQVAGDTICYAATEATDKAPKSANHGDVWFYVTNWKSGRARSQPSLKVGYDLRPELTPAARIGRSNWTLFPAGNEAFAHDEDDARLVRELKRGVGTAHRGGLGAKHGGHVSFFPGRLLCRHRQGRGGLPIEV